MRRARLLVAALVLARAAVPAPARAAELRAEQITAETAPDLLIGGPDAIGGVGDWYLANDRIEVVVDDPGRRHAKLNHGGTLVDAGLRDRRGEDQLARLFPLVNLSQRIFLNYDTIAAEVDDDGGWARLVVSSTRGLDSAPRGGALARRLDPLVPAPEALAGVFAETEYAVLPGEPFVHVTTTLRNEGDAPAPVFAYGDVWMRGGRSARSWVGNVLAPERSRGFRHRSFDRADILGAGDAMAAFTHVVVPGLRHYPPIAYAVFAPERAAQGQVLFGVTGEHVTFLNAFVHDPGWEELTLPRLLAATRESLAPGETWTFRRRFLVAGHNDVAAATDAIFAAAGVADGRAGAAGRVAPADVPTVLEFDLAETGAPVTEVETRTSGPRAGRYRAALPPGRYAVTARAPHRPPRRFEVRIDEGAFREVAVLRHASTGALRFGPGFADGGPGRVIVEGLGETPDPVFGPELLDFRIDGAPGRSGTETRELYFTGGPRDPGEVEIAPGRYRLTAVRGLEYDLAQQEVLVRAGRETPVAPFALERAVDLDGFVRADFHVHAEASDDSSMTVDTRLATYLAEGVEVIATTDHDHLGFYEPALDALDARGRIRVIQGVEVTSSAPSHVAPWTIGHHNAWPIPYRPLLHRKGAPASQARSVGDLYGSLRRDYGVRVVQLNHPRDAPASGVDEEAFLSHLGTEGRPLDVTRPLTEPPNDALLRPAADGTRAIDFDAMEVMNGRSHDEFLVVREDWYGLLRQGFVRTGTANADSHGPGQLAGYPRNYVQVSAATAADPAAFDAAVRDGRLFGTNGPLFPVFSANGGRMGDRVSAPGGRVRVEFAVAAAPWVPVEEVRLLVNGRVARRYRDLPDGTSLRLSRREELALPRDAFLTLEAGAPLAAEREAWLAAHDGPYATRVAPGFVPAAFTNPIFVDVDGDGAIAVQVPPPHREPGGGPALAAVAAGALLVGLLAGRRRRRAPGQSPPDERA